MNDNVKFAKELLALAKNLVADSDEGEYKKKWKGYYGYEDGLQEKVAIRCGGAFKLLKKNSAIHMKGVGMVFSLIARDFQLAKRKMEAVLAEVKKSEWLASDEACVIRDDYTVEIWIGGNEAFYKKACEEYESLTDGASGIEETKAMVTAEENAMALLKEEVGKLQSKVDAITEQN